MQCSKFGAYSISSSAAADSPIGTSRPSAFAVLRLMTSSNLFGFWTGRSAGLGAFEDAVPCRLAELFGVIVAIGDQTT